MTRSALDLDALLGTDWRHAVEIRRSEITQRIGGRTDLVLFGAGGLGRQIRRDMDGLPFNPLAFVDNNSSLWAAISTASKSWPRALRRRASGRAPCG